MTIATRKRQKLVPLTKPELKIALKSEAWKAEYKYLSRQYGKATGLRYLAVVSRSGLVPGAPRGKGTKSA